MAERRIANVSKDPKSTTPQPQKQDDVDTKINNLMSVYITKINEVINSQSDTINALVAKVNSLNDEMSKLTGTIVRNSTSYDQKFADVDNMMRSLVIGYNQLRDSQINLEAGLTEIKTYFERELPEDLIEEPIEPDIKEDNETPEPKL